MMSHNLSFYFQPKCASRDARQPSQSSSSTACMSKRTERPSKSIKSSKPISKENDNLTTKLSTLLSEMCVENQELKERNAELESLLVEASDQIERQEAALSEISKLYTELLQKIQESNPAEVEHSIEANSENHSEEQDDNSKLDDD